MLDKASEHGSFEFGSGFIINRHGHDLAVSSVPVQQLISTIDGQSSHILLYRQANEAGQEGYVLAGPPRKRSLAADSRRGCAIVKELI
jgi:hypothetical protein